MVRLPDYRPLQMNAGDYGGTYKLIGGALSLDFVNTVSFPASDQPHDWLDRAENFLVWAGASGLLVESDLADWTQRLTRAASEVEPAMARVRRTRAVLADVLQPVVRGEEVPADSGRRFNALFRDTIGHRSIGWSDLSWGWDDARTLDDVLRPVVLDAALLLTEGDRERLRHCPGCDWLFYDVTRNRSRRWCDMQDCGSRAKSRRYYRRSRVQNPD